MNLSGKRVLVTGAGGFIGSHLTERLVQSGAEVRAFVHYRNTGSWGWLDESPCREDIEVAAGDICDRDSCNKAAEDCEIIFHLAALIAIPYSYHAPFSYARTNVEGTLNILQAARQNKTTRVVHTSTSEVYGTARYVPIDEDHPLQGQSPYSASKIGADKMAEAFYLSYGLPVVTVRPFNTYGPRQSARAVIPAIMSQCLNGGTVRLGNTHPLRDFTYVSDTVEGFIAAAFAPQAVGQTFNLGSGTEINIGNLAQEISSLTGGSIEVLQEAERIRPAGSEVERLLAANQRARQVLGWQPKVSLREGLRKTIHWMKEHQGAYRAGVYSV